MKLGAAAQATSRTFFALNRQVRVGLAPGERGRVNDRPTSDFAMMGTVVSDFSAVARRARCVGVRTSARFRRVAVAAATKLPGTARATSKAPYSRLNSPLPRSR